MACNDIVSAILHYKRNIDKISDPPERALKYEDRLLHCINKLYKLPVNVNHLQETGVGRTVNSLRKIEGQKGLGDAAKALVAKWKTMVMLEDEAERKQREEECTGPSEEDLNRIKLIREAEKSESRKTEINSLSSKPSDNHKSKNQEDIKKHRHETLETSKSKKRKHESDEEDKIQSKRRETLNSNSENLERSTGSSSEYHKSKSKSHSSSHKSDHKSSSSHKNHESSREEKRKEKDKRSDSKSSSKYSSESSSSKLHKSSHKSYDKHESKNKKHKEKAYPENDGFDSQSGASFADALGPMLVKKSPKKKSSHSPAVSSPAPSDNSSDNSLPAMKEKNVKKDVKDTLFSQVKLEPLEPDLVATLPVPTPYYKPHPTYIPTQEAVRRRVQAEEDALSMVMSNKNSRTKIYSGVKGGLPYVPSLYECCCRVLQQHIDALEYTGGIPFSLLKPVLESATPSQLYQFEHFNPYIIEDTDDLWKFHVNKEFRNEKRQEFESWRDMYLRCLDEREEKYKAVTANIMQRTIENSVPVRKAKLAYIDVAKPPRNILRKQIKNGTSKPDSSRLLGKNDPEAVRVSAPKQPTVKEPAVFKSKPKVAPLMQKTLKSIKMSRFKR